MGEVCKREDQFVGCLETGEGFFLLVERNSSRTSPGVWVAFVAGLFWSPLSS